MVESGSSNNSNSIRQVSLTQCSGHRRGHRDARFMGGDTVGRRRAAAWRSPQLLVVEPACGLRRPPSSLWASAGPRVPSLVVGVGWGAAPSPGAVLQADHVFVVLSTPHLAEQPDPAPLPAGLGPDGMVASQGPMGGGSILKATSKETVPFFTQNMTHSLQMGTSERTFCWKLGSRGSILPPTQGHGGYSAADVLL